MLVGTKHFLSLQHAQRYYRTYGFNYLDIARKVKEGEIQIGRPTVGKGERVIVREGRYFIEG